jgi:enoyl-CoA hydratase/carnithine racemase
MSEGATLTVEEGIATLTLDRPESLNALSEELMRTLERQVRRIAAMPDLRAVIVTGAGRAFCAGGDLLGFEEALKSGGTRLVDMLKFNQDVVQMVEDLPVPVIGAANGTAVAGGLELLLACDIILAAEGARIGDGHAKYGIVPAGGSTVRLGERVGPGRAARLLYTAALVDAAQLAEWGLVDEVLPAERLMARATEIAREIAAASPEVVRHMKSLKQRSHDAARKARLDAEIAAFREHVKGADLQEGLAAFREKRRPQYRT